MPSCNQRALLCQGAACVSMLMFHDGDSVSHFDRAIIAKRYRNFALCTVNCALERSDKLEFGLVYGFRMKNWVQNRMVFGKLRVEFLVLVWYYSVV